MFGYEELLIMKVVQRSPTGLADQLLESTVPSCASHLNFPFSLNDIHTIHLVFVVKINQNYIMFSNPPISFPTEPHAAVLYNTYSLADPHDQWLMTKWPEVSVSVLSLA